MHRAPPPVNPSRAAGIRVTLTGHNWLFVARSGGRSAAPPAIPRSAEMRVKGHVKLLATSTGRHLVHPLVAEAVLASAANSIQRGDVEVIAVPVVEHGRSRTLQILITPATQLSVGDADGDDVELSEEDLRALAVLRSTTSGLEEELDDVDLAATFVDFGSYPG